MNSISRKVSKPKVAPKRISQKKRRAILDAALYHFAQFGFSKVTMDEIASTAGMGKASLYYYFPAKEEILEAVVSEANKAFIDEMEELLTRNQSAAEKIDAYVQRRFEHHLGLRNMNFNELKETEKLQPLLTQIFKEFSASEISIIERVIETGNAAGEFHVEHPGKVAEAFIHMITGVRIRHHKAIARDKNSNPHINDLKKEIQLLTCIFNKGLSA